jgi:hypothetical protein
VDVPIRDGIKSDVRRKEKKVANEIDKCVRRAENGTVPRPCCLRAGLESSTGRPRDSLV